MTDKEQFDLYAALDKNNVTVKEERHPMRTQGAFYIDTQYTFGEYMTKHTKYIPRPKVNPLGHFTIYKRNTNIAFWNESHGGQTRYIYDICMAVKNKAEGKPYVNPFNNPGDLTTIGYRFEQSMDECLPKILPGTMSKYRAAITKQMRQFFENTVKQYQ